MCFFQSFRALRRLGGRETVDGGATHDADVFSQGFRSSMYVFNSSLREISESKSE